MNTPSPSGPGPEQALLTLRIIAGSLVVGVTLFAFVAWFAGLEGDARPEGRGLVFGGLLVMAVVALAGAILLWRARVVPLTLPSRDWAERFPRLQTSLIIVWAIIETPALLAEAVYFLYGDVPSGLLGIAIIWIGIGLTWPKRAWIGRA